MGLAVHTRPGATGDRAYEVGYTNMYGGFRIEDVWSPYGGVTHAEAEEFVARATAALREIGEDILAKRPAPPKKQKQKPQRQKK